MYHGVYYNSCEVFTSTSHFSLSLSLSAVFQSFFRRLRIQSDKAYKNRKTLPLDSKSGKRIGQRWSVHMISFENHIDGTRSFEGKKKKRIRREKDRYSCDLFVRCFYAIVMNWIIIFHLSSGIENLYFCFFPLVLKNLSLWLSFSYSLIEGSFFWMFQIVNHWNRKMAWEAPKMQRNATLNAITAKHMNDEKSHIKLIWHFSEQKQTFFFLLSLCFGVIFFCKRNNNKRNNWKISVRPLSVWPMCALFGLKLTESLREQECKRAILFQ